MEAPSPTAMDTTTVDGSVNFLMSSPRTLPCINDQDTTMDVRSSQNQAISEPSMEPMAQTIQLQQSEPDLKTQPNPFLALNFDGSQPLQNVLGQFFTGPSLNNSLNGMSFFQTPNGNVQLFNTNSGFIFSTENANIPSTSFIIQQPSQTLAQTVPSQSVLMNSGPALAPNTFFINPNLPNQSPTFILNPLGSSTQHNGTQANTTLLVAPANLAGGNPTILTNFLNSSSLQNSLDSSGNNTTVVIAPSNFTDPNTLLLGPSIAPSTQPVTIPLNPAVASTAQSVSAVAKPSSSMPSTSTKPSGKSQSQKTILELLNEDEQKRVQVEEKSLAEELEKNRDALALRLKLRRPREELISQGIMPSFKSTPAFHEQLQKLERAKVGDHLQKKMRMRPDKKQLVHQHILEDTHVDPLINATQQRLKRARLEQDLDSKIKNRPGPLELIEGNILKADNVVEQIVKDGRVRFMKTSNNPREDTSPYSFYEESMSDEALSPPQPETASIDMQPLSVGGIPSPPDFSQYLESAKTDHSSVSQIGVTPPINIAPSFSGVSFKQEHDLGSAPSYQSVITGTNHSYVQSSSSSLIPSSSSSSSRSNQSNRQRKKQAKRSKPKEIKFHEYKPPNEQGTKAATQSSGGNPYNLLLMQQQLFLQLQLLQQQQQMMVPGNQASTTSPTNTSASNSMMVSNSMASTPAVSSTQLQQPQAAITASTSTSPAQPEKCAANTSCVSSANIASTKTFSLANLDDMKVAELKAELKSRGLHVSGTKPQLIERLRHAELTAQVNAASSPDVSSTGIHCNPSRVSSSTDISLDAISNCSSNRPSLSTPPISPEYKSSFSVTSEPMSPGSAFDPISPPTFQPIKPPPSVSSQHSTHTSLSSCQTPDSVRLSEDLSPSMNIQLQSPRSVGPSIETSIAEMMDMSEFNFTDTHVSSELLKKQQKKIEELQRALQLSQLQLQQQTQFAQFYPPPPPPPPQSAPKSIRPMQQTVMRTLSNPLPPPPPPLISSQFMTEQIKMKSPPVNKTMFQGQDFAYTLNQQPKKFTFSPLPPNGQPFHFSHTSSSELKTVQSLQNGIVTPKSNSLPSSPTENPILELGAGLARSITNPNFMAPPPNYEDAVRQNKERKAHMFSPPPPMPPTSSAMDMQSIGLSASPINNNQLSIDDLLEVLVGHGYQIPGGDSNLPSATKESDLTVPPYSISTMANQVYSMQNSIAQTSMAGDHQFQHNTSSASHTPLPMDIDNPNLDLSPLNLNSVTAAQESNSSDHRQSPKIKYEVPHMQIDSTDTDNNLLSLTMESGSPADNAFSSALMGDNDLSWIDLMLPHSTSAGIPSMNTGPSNRLTADNLPHGAFGKDPFPLNLVDFPDVGTPTELNHLDGDVWDNIPASE